MNTNPNESNTPYPPAVGGAGSVGAIVLEREPLTRQTSSSPDPADSLYWSKRKAILLAETVQSLPPSESSSQIPTSESFSQSIIGAPSDTSNGTANGLRDMRFRMPSEKSSPPSGTQVGGSHYKAMKIQPVEFVHANGIPFIEGCVIKYVCRWRDKGGLEDLRKAKHFLDILLELEEKE